MFIRTGSLSILTAVVVMLTAVPWYSAADDDVEFEIVSGNSGSSKSRSRNLTVSDDNSAEFEVVASPEKSAGKKSSRKSQRYGRNPADEIMVDDDEIITDDPDFEVVRRRLTSSEVNAVEEKHDAEMEAYRERYREADRIRDYFFFKYHPLHNKINGLDARLFIILFVFSLISAVIMMVIIIRELGMRPPVYSLEQMIQLRAEGYASVSENDAKSLVMNLWYNAVGGKPLHDGAVEIGSRSELDILENEIADVASTLPTDPEAVDRLNALADSVCYWRRRYMIAPWLSVDSGLVKRIFMGIFYVILLCIYPAHPMYLLVILSPIAFWTPAYLVPVREGSLVYQMLGGSLKIFGKMTGSALNGAASMEGASVTVYSDGYGNKYVEHNYWGVLIVFAIKIAAALLFLYLVYVLAPFMIFYAIVRNYILAK